MDTRPMGPWTGRASEPDHQPSYHGAVLRIARSPSVPLDTTVSFANGLLDVLDECSGPGHTLFEYRR
jgi:hypothetical protein